MSEFGGLTDKTTFVLNEIYPRSMITAAQIEAHLGIKVSATVPYEGDAMARAVNEGHPLVTMARRGTCRILPSSSSQKRSPTRSLRSASSRSRHANRVEFGSILRRSRLCCPPRSSTRTAAREYSQQQSLSSVRFRPPNRAVGRSDRVVYRESPKNINLAHIGRVVHLPGTPSTLMQQGFGCSRLWAKASVP